MTGTGTLGQQLRQARKARNLSIEQAVSATRIRAHYLQAIEADQFELLPSLVHKRGFIRAYADYLGLDGEALIGGETNIAEPGSAMDANARINPIRAESLAQEESGAQEVQHGGGKPDSAQQAAGLLQQKAEAIFVDIGQQLKRRRELLGLSLEDVERHTHLRQHYLVALEAGDQAGLPSPVQGRGMLNNYAAFLGLNPDTLLLLFAEGLQTQLKARQVVLPGNSHSDVIARNEAIPQDGSYPPNSPNPPEGAQRLSTKLARRFFSPDFLIGGILAVFLIGFLFWGVIRVFSMISNTELSPTAPSIAEVLLATATPSETPTPEPFTPTSPPVAQLFPTLSIVTGTPEEGAPPESGATQSAVQVYLTIQQRAWIRVTVDGEIQFEGRVIPGSAYPFVGDSQVEVLTGNGAALQVFFNGADLGLMGEPGQIAHQVYTSQGVFAPTPTVTPTPTQTLPVTATAVAQTPAP